MLAFSAVLLSSLLSPPLWSTLATPPISIYRTIPQPLIMSSSSKETVPYAPLPLPVGRSHPPRGILSPRPRTSGHERSAVQHQLPHHTRHPQLGHAHHHPAPASTRRPQLERAHHPGPRSLYQTPMRSFLPSLLATPFANRPAGSVERPTMLRFSWPTRGEKAATTTRRPEDTSAS